MLIDVVVFLLFQATDRASAFDLLFIVGNDELVDYEARMIGMVHARSWPTAFQVPIDAVATVKEFTDITANVMFNHKTPTWMLCHKFTHIKYELIENNKLGVLIMNSIEEFSLCDVRYLLEYFQRHLVFHAHSIDDLASQ